jgi:citrate lyase subunit beta/citryl-CoA lyase
MLDMLNSLNLSQELMRVDNPTALYLLSKCLVEAKSCGFEIVGLTYQDYNNIDGFREWAMRLKSIGYDGMGCIGPKQVEIANEVFMPSKDEIERAKHIKKSFEYHKSLGESGFMDEEFGFIDEPIYKDALLLLDNLERFSS